MTLVDCLGDTKLLKFKYEDLRCELDNQYILGGIDRHMQFIVAKKIDKVIVLGTYSGRDQQQLRIESFAYNRFRNGIISNNYPRTHKLSLNTLVTNDLPVKITDGIGNSWCNLFCYQLLSRLNANENAAVVKVYFVHIPKQIMSSGDCFTLDKTIEAINAQ